MKAQKCDHIFDHTFNVHDIFTWENYCTLQYLVQLFVWKQRTEIYIFNKSILWVI